MPIDPYEGMPGRSQEQLDKQTKKTSDDYVTTVREQSGRQQDFERRLRQDVDRANRQAVDPFSPQDDEDEED